MKVLRHGKAVEIDDAMRLDAKTIAHLTLLTDLLREDNEILVRSLREFAERALAMIEIVKQDAFEKGYQQGLNKGADNVA